MPRLFIPINTILDDRILITGDQLHYLSKVLRLKVGESLEIIDPDQNIQYRTTIEKTSKTEMMVLVDSSAPIKTSNALPITLIQGIPKGPKMDYVIQKCTEIGVDTFFMLLSKRVVPEMQDKPQKKLTRWHKIALEAAKQSGRFDIPSIDGPVEIDNLQAIYAQHDLNLILWEEERTHTLKAVLQSCKPATVSVTIGPEGGFAPDEVKKMAEFGGKIVTVGETILRTETAGLVACSMINYEYCL